MNRRILKKYDIRYGMDLSGLGKIRLAVCFENDENPPDFAKSGRFLQYLLAY
jgi:hypothetical protein